MEKLLIGFDIRIAVISKQIRDQIFIRMFFLRLLVSVTGQQLYNIRTNIRCRTRKKTLLKKSEQKKRPAGKTSRPFNYGMNEITLPSSLQQMPRQPELLLLVQIPPEPPP